MDIISAVSKKRLLLTLCPIFLLFYMGDAILSSYYSLYYIHNGLSATEQSILLGLIPFCLFLGCVVLSRFARNGKATLWLFRICAFLETGLTLAFSFCHSFPTLAVLTALCYLAISFSASFRSSNVITSRRPSSPSPLASLS